MKKGIGAVTVLLITYCLSLCGCFRKDPDHEKNMVRLDGRTGYSETICDIPVELGSSYDVFRVVEAVLKGDDLFYVVVRNSDYGSGAVIDTVLYEISDDGEIIAQYEMGTDSASCYAIVEDTIACFSESKTEFWSLENQRIVKTIDAQQLPITVSPYNDGYVACFRNSVVRYDNEGNEVGRIDNDEFGYFSAYCDSVYEQDGKIILVACPGFEYRYYEIDFDSGYCNYLGNNSDYGFDIVYGCGNYIFDDIGEYKLDVFTGEKTLLCEWNNTNVRPGGRPASGYRLYHTFGDDLFVESYVDENDTVSIQFYRYDNTIDYSDSVILTVGGVGMKYDIPLRMAVYQYNISQDEYRVVLSEFEGYGSSNEEDMEATARLISEFQAGNSPDIFWGNYFDYEYFGRNDLVVDILPYLENSDIFDYSDIEDSIWHIMCKDGHCYQLFNSFYFNGFWGKTSLMADYTDMDYHEMFSLENDDGSVFGTFYCNDLASIVVNDSFKELIDGNDLIISEEDIADIVDKCLTRGYPRTTSFEEMSFVTFDDLRNNEYLMSNSVITGLMYYDRASQSAKDELCYIGSPSINGAVHKICPQGNVAVSAYSAYPEACVDFLTYFFCDEVQRYLISMGYPSARKSVNEELYTYALSPTSIPEDQYIYRRLLSGVDSVSEETINEYNVCIGLIDTLEIYDWSVYQIITEELSANDLQGKPADEIAESLYSRLNVYVSDYYG